MRSLGLGLKNCCLLGGYFIVCICMVFMELADTYSSK